MGKHSKTSAKNHFTDKQAFTWAEHEVNGRTLIVPDTANAYGDEVSAARMSEDYVGAKTGDNEAATAAGESARDQFNMDTEARLMAIKAQQYYSQYASMGVLAITDNTGKITGVKVLLRHIDPETQHETYTDRFISMEDLEAAKAAMPRG